MTGRLTRNTDEVSEMGGRGGGGGGFVAGAAEDLYLLLWQHDTHTTRTVWSDKTG